MKMIEHPSKLASNERQSKQMTIEHPVSIIASPLAADSPLWRKAAIYRYPMRSDSSFELETIGLKDLKS